MNWILWITTSLFLISCSKKATEPSFTNSEMPSYDPRIEDTLEFDPHSNNFDFESTLQITKSKNSDSPLLSKSVDIFKLSEYSILLAQNQQSPFSEFGHSLLKIYYSNETNTTRYDENNTPYLGAALGSEGRAIQELFQKMGTPENIQLVENFFKCESTGTVRCLKIAWPEETPTLKPIEFVYSIKKYLEENVSRMQSSGVSKEFIATFKVSVEQKYISPLVATETELKLINGESLLQDTVSAVTKTIQSLKFLPQDVVVSILKKMDSAQTYADLLNNKGENVNVYSSNILKVIANVWLELKTDEKRVLYVKTANPLLYESLRSQSDVFIRWLAGISTDLGGNSGWVEWITPSMVKGRYTDKLKKSCHADVKSHLEKWVKFNIKKKEKFKSQDPDLYGVFASYSNEELLKNILTQYDNSDKEFGTWATASESFVEKLAPICLGKVALLLNKAINSYTLTALDEQIRGLGPLIEGIIAKKTIEDINKLAVGVSTPENFSEYFETLAKKTLKENKEMVFYETTSLPGLERTNVKLNISSDNKLSTQSGVEDQFETGAETLGAGLVANYYRFQGLESIEKMPVDSNQYVQIVFSNINKMLSMVGYENFDHSMAPSLHRKMNDDHEEFDVNKYECSPRKVSCQQAAAVPLESKEDCSGKSNFYRSLYQVPDRLAIQGAFQPVDNVFDKRTSVYGQAEIIRGASLMLKYFQDWKSGEDDYDRGMGRKKFGDINIYPKKAFVNLTVGLATIPVRGFKKPKSGIRLFKLDGREAVNWAEDLLAVEGQDKCELNRDQVSASKNTMNGIGAASISDIVQKSTGNMGPSDTVNAQGLAQMIIAIDEFLAATEGIAASNATIIKPKNLQDIGKSNLKSILEGRELLEKMMYGMFSFMISRLQDEDRGFHTGYSLKSFSRLQETPRTTVEHLYLIDALLRVYKRWGAEIALRAAIEAYYFMNNSLWDVNTGFYKLTEKEPPMVVFAQTIYTLELLRPYIKDPRSSQNLEKLLSFYKEQYQSWISKILH